MRLTPTAGKLVHARPVIAPTDQCLPNVMARPDFDLPGSPELATISTQSHHRGLVWGLAELAATWARAGRAAPGRLLG